MQDQKSVVCDNEINNLHDPHPLITSFGFKH